MSAISPIIVVDEISKRYRLGSRSGGLFAYRTLRDSLAESASAVFRRAAPDARRETTADHIFALRDVSLKIGAGEVVGIVGRNGAGKSTLLKILSRITRPTSGSARLRGRVGSLLEVGTGFHPELTGRDNIYLNGAILGMARAEIQRKFDDIVDFSGVSKFIDTPVKRYSSGMYVRLAFAVAAHLEPEILLVDEVLAVGDAAFQRQCLGKMHDISRSGRTILFVSHNMPAITRLCDRALLFADGSLIDDGPSDRIVARYLGSAFGTTARRDWSDPGEAPGNSWVRLRSIRVVTEAFDTTETIDIRHSFGIEICFDVLGEGAPIVPGIALSNDQGQEIFGAMDTDQAWRTPRPSGRYVSVAWIPGNLLNEGTTIVSVALGTHSPGGKMIRQAQAQEVIAFQVIDPGEGGTSRGDHVGIWSGPVRPLLRWALSRESLT